MAANNVMRAPFICSMLKVGMDWAEKHLLGAEIFFGLDVDLERFGKRGKLGYGLPSLSHTISIFKDRQTRR
jgi:hypothetical protein